jgi:hypothetical protein
MNTVSSIASTAGALPPATPPAGDACGAGASSGKGAPVTASPEPQISPRARALAELYDAASAFVQKEHFEPFTGWKYSGGSSGYVLNNESAYMDIERYNNYLFDKVAAKLVDQAGQLGLALDKKDVLAQLKADNADIAAIRYSDADRVKYLKMCASVGFSKLTSSDVDSLTDMYITAKENGLDATQVHSVAFWKGLYIHNGATMAEADHPPNKLNPTPEEIAASEAKYFATFQNKIDIASELRAKLVNTAFGFHDENGFFDQFLNPRITLPGVNDSILNFLSQMLDIYSQPVQAGQTFPEK